MTGADRIPDDERMTPAELRVVREYLGLTGEWLAQELGVQDRTWRRWEAGTSPIPDGVRLHIERIEQETADLVHSTVQRLLDLPDPLVVTYRSDAEYRRAHPELRWPAAWHRAVIARVAQEVPALSIDYPTSGPDQALPAYPRTGAVTITDHGPPNPATPTG